ncbi:MAG TPA: hypothetical protein VKM93_22495 [Terriglobia bacterium]|nr:hypothetical protein [Terriglobia bacterium]
MTPTNFPSLSTNPSPAVDVLCNQTWSSQGQACTWTTEHNNCRLMDVFYPHAVGAPGSGTAAYYSTHPITVYIHGGGLSLMNRDKEVQGTGMPNLAVAVVNTTGGVFYTINYQLAAGMFLASGYSSGATSLNWTTAPSYEAYGSTSMGQVAGTPFYVMLDRTLSTQEVVEVTGNACSPSCTSEASSPPMTGTFTLASPTVYAHAQYANAVPEIAMWPAQIADVDCFMQYLANTTGAGNAMDIRLIGESSGGLLTAYEFLNPGANLVSGNNVAGVKNGCEFSGGVYKVTRAVANSPHTDLGTEYVWQTGTYCPAHPNSGACSEARADEIAWGCAGKTGTACNSLYESSSPVSFLGSGTLGLGTRLLTQYGCSDPPTCDSDINAPPVQGSIAFNTAWAALGVKQPVLAQSGPGTASGHVTDLFMPGGSTTWGTGSFGTYANGLVDYGAESGTAMPTAVQFLQNATSSSSVGVSAGGTAH